ncbi:MAG TPA: SRPBCC family protein [Acidimicrobiales bacterium]|jgi:ribosome-associated toxin RatA of RatAB toxin-antitoxin module|nr:SRPBCC family protein [Acidimicrobiales bacterium]
MTERAVESISVAAEPGTVFAVAVDLEDYPEWVGDLKSVVVTERDQNGRPLVATFRAAAFGRSSTYTLRYDYDEAPTVLSWVMVEGDLTSKLDGSYRFEPADGGTLVTYQLEVELRVPIPGFVKQRAAQRIQGTALRELKARAESLS